MFQTVVLAVELMPLIYFILLWSIWESNPFLLIII
ncbi:MAG: DUF1270 family protein [Flavobacterium johnsoniae]|nr:MAG: DUF1270 family protein [Flavobacterium johnsoniae]